MTAPSRRRLRAVERSLVWMVGSPRTGSSWLLALLRSHPRVAGCDEPLIGLHLGAGVDQIIRVGGSEGDGGVERVYDASRSRDDYFFSDAHATAWEPALRALVLRRLAAQVAPGRRRSPRVCVLKEPHGSEAADLISRVTPQSRLLLLLRDGRDVVDSELDAVRPGGWGTRAIGTLSSDAKERLRVLEEQAHRWRARTRVALAAYDGHDPARRLELRYEDLLADTEERLRRLFDWLGLAAPPQLADTVARLSFSALPEHGRGPGKFARAASPGAWRDNFTAAERELVNRVMEPELTRLGYPLD